MTLFWCILLLSVFSPRAEFSVVARFTRALFWKGKLDGNPVLDSTLFGLDKVSLNPPTHFLLGNASLETVFWVALLHFC